MPIPDLVKAATTQLKQIVLDSSVQQLQDILPSPSPIKKPIKEWHGESTEPVVEVREDPESRKKHYRINMMASTPNIMNSRRTESLRRSADRQIDT